MKRSINGCVAMMCGYEATPGPCRSLSGSADMGDRLDLDLQRRIRQGRHLHQGRGGEIAREEFAARLPDFLALRNVGDENRHLDDVGHGPARGLDETADLAKDRLRLNVF